MEKLIMFSIILLFLLFFLYFIRLVLSVTLEKHQMDKKETKKQKRRQTQKIIKIKNKINLLFPLLLLLFLFCIVFSFIQLGELVNKSINIEQEKVNDQAKLSELENEVRELNSYNYYPIDGLSSLKVGVSLWTESTLQKQFKVGLTKELSEYFPQSLVIVELNNEEHGLKLTLKESEELSLTSKSYYFYIINKLLEDIEKENTINQVAITSSLEDDVEEVIYKRENNQQFEKQEIITQPILESDKRE